ncbi:hypothetical protein FJTKL_01358 [Diaporthe vaccinii]|uniref:Rhodopsin domain-containing protein n=1 Tax=Diaporthe vaccinii TaxID=105482 RepID=A0ABR4E0V8_9PEZI
MLTPTETVAMEWVFFVLAFLFLVARFWVRFSLRQHQAWISDVLLVIGLICTVGNIMCDTLIYKVDGLLEYKHVTQYLGKIRFATKFFFDAGLYFPKFSLLMSYATMVPVTEPRMRIFLGCIAVYLVLACLTAVFSDLFWCGKDVSINWLNPHKCSSFSNPHLQKVTWTMNIVGELLLFVFPFPILNSLKFTQLREKIGLGLIFALGFFTILVSTGRFMFMVFLTNDISLSVWTTVEMSISVMVVSLMAMRPLLRRFGQAVTKTISRIKKDSTDQRNKEPRLPSHERDMSDEKAPLPYNTDRWWKWPVDLDANTMSVTTQSGSMGTQRTGMSTQISTRASQISRKATRHDTAGTGLLLREEPPGPLEMDAKEVQMLGNVVIDSDHEGLPVWQTCILQQHPLLLFAHLSSRRDTNATMAPKVKPSRYPKRKRAEVNYEIDLSIDGDLDLEDAGYISEELGEDSTASASSTHSQQPDAAAEVEVDSEFEDATFGSRRIKKRKVVAKPKAKSQPKAKPPPKFKPFRLMDLPPELRLKVYEEALVDPHGVNIRTYSDRWESFPVHVSLNDVRGGYVSGLNRSCYVRGQWTKIDDDAMPKKKYQLSPNLLATCKTVHDEAVSFLWTQPFIFADVHGLHAFLLMLRPATISRLRDITLLKYGWINNRCLQAFVLLRDAPLLQNLRLNCTVRPNIRTRSGVPKEVGIGQQLATKLYRDCYPFLKALAQHQGPESILSVFKFHRDEFKSSYFNPATVTWVEDSWSQARQEKILAAMIADLNTIMSRKIVPRFPRSRY